MVHTNATWRRMTSRRPRLLKGSFVIDAPGASSQGTRPWSKSPRALDVFACSAPTLLPSQLAVRLVPELAGRPVHLRQNGRVTSHLSDRGIRGTRLSNRPRHQ